MFYAKVVRSLLLVSIQRHAYEFLRVSASVFVGMETATTSFSGSEYFCFSILKAMFIFEWIFVGKPRLFRLLKIWNRPVMFFSFQWTENLDTSATSSYRNSRSVTRFSWSLNAEVYQLFVLFRSSWIVF